MYTNKENKNKCLNKITTRSKEKKIKRINGEERKETERKNKQE